jgi:uncharacterized protein with FMN-binding domain
MKRVLLTVTGTVLGLVALLSFKAHGHPLSNPGGLPAASLPGASTFAPTNGASGSTGTSGSSAPPNPARPGTSSTVQAKKYLGTAVQTRYGIVQIAVSVAAHKIDSVSFVQLTAFDGHSQQINSQAAPILLHETLSAQSAHIDTVSGASYTSAGYVQSLQSALDKAGLP